MAHRLALLVTCLASLLPTAWRAFGPSVRPPASCAPGGRGVAPRLWLGCAADGGPARDLFGRERLLSGLRIDLARAGPEDLGVVPGLTPRLAVAVIAEREAGGPFREVDDLLRVRGIGPVRLAKAKPHLALWP